MGLRSRRFGNAQLEIAAGYGLLAFDAHGNEHALLGNARLRVQLSPSWSAFVSRLSLATRHWRSGGDAAVGDFGQNRIVLQFRYRL